MIAEDGQAPGRQPADRAPDRLAASVRVLVVEVPEEGSPLDGEEIRERATAAGFRPVEPQSMGRLAPGSRAGAAAYTVASLAEARSALAFLAAEAGPAVGWEAAVWDVHPDKKSRVMVERLEAPAEEVRGGAPGAGEIGYEEAMALMASPACPWPGPEEPAEDLEAQRGPESGDLRQGGPRAASSAEAEPGAAEVPAAPRCAGPAGEPAPCAPAPRPGGAKDEDARALEEVRVDREGLADCVLPDLAPSNVAEALARAVAGDPCTPAKAEMLGVTPAVGMVVDGPDGADIDYLDEARNEAAIAYFDATSRLTSQYANDRAKLRSLDERAFGDARSYVASLCRQASPRRVDSLDETGEGLRRRARELDEKVSGMRRAYTQGMREAMEEAALQAARSYASEHRARALANCEDEMRRGSLEMAEGLAAYAMRAYEALIYAEHALDERPGDDPALQEAARSYLSMARYSQMKNRELARLIQQTLAQPAGAASGAAGDGRGLGESPDARPDARLPGDETRGLGAEGDGSAPGCQGCGAEEGGWGAEGERAPEAEARDEGGWEEPFERPVSEAPRGPEGPADPPVVRTEECVPAGDAVGWGDLGPGAPDPVGEDDDGQTLVSPISTSEFEALLAEDEDFDDLKEDGEGQVCDAGACPPPEGPHGAARGEGAGAPRRRRLGRPLAVLALVVLIAAVAAAALAASGAFSGAPEPQVLEEDPRGLYEVGERYVVVMSQPDGTSGTTRVTVAGFVDRPGDDGDAVVMRDPDGNDYDVDYAQMAEIAGADVNAGQSAGSVGEARPSFEPYGGDPAKLSKVDPERRYSVGDAFEGGQGVLTVEGFDEGEGLVVVSDEDEALYALSYEGADGLGAA